MSDLTQDSVSMAADSGTGDGATDGEKKTVAVMGGVEEEFVGGGEKGGCGALGSRGGGWTED